MQRTYSNEEMDFQDAVFQALEHKKRNDDDDDPGSASSRPNGNSTAAATASEPTQVKGGQANGNGHAEPMTDSDRSSPVVAAPVGSSSAAAPPTTTASASKRNGGAPPQLQLPINLGYMFPSGSSDSGSRPGSRAASESRSPHRRRTAQTDYSTVLPQIASHHLPPSSPTSPTSAATNLNALGLDTPRPKARSQASYSWFDYQAGGHFPATQNRTASSSKQRRDMSNSPARTDSRRGSPPVTSQVDGGGAGVRSPDQNGVSLPVSPFFFLALSVGIRLTEFCL